MPIDRLVSYTEKLYLARLMGMSERTIGGVVPYKAVEC